ncbi:MAG: branched-chain amino acid ABC transporter permease [Gammaproteobacteria bacterium]|nr:branched-chain amino acid ABC transporter permease [Gammaproteobacteria bacterium]
MMSLWYKMVVWMGCFVLGILSLWGILDNPKFFVVTLLNGLTLASLYFIVASGFTLIFGLLRNINLAHGTFYLMGGYIGYVVMDATHWWLLSLVVSVCVVAGLGLLLQVGILRYMQGDEMRQTLVTIGISVVMADLFLLIFTGATYQIESPEWLTGPLRNLPLINSYAKYRLSLIGFGLLIGVFLWLLLNRTRLGTLIRAGVDDRVMLSAVGINVNLLFALTFMLGAGLAGMGGVIGAVELSISPGEDARLLLASLIVVIVGGLGSIVGAAVGSLILAMAETFGLAYVPTYSIVFTFLMLIVVLAFKPHGIFGREAR